MDTNEIYEHGRARFEHAAARRLLREKYQAKMLFAHAGGMWQAGPNLLATLAACPDTTAVIEDSYGNPVKVDVGELKKLCQERWQEQMSAWLIEHVEIIARR